MANLEKIITLTDSQYQTLVNGGSITSGGKTYNFDANALYVVPEETIALSDIDGTTDLQAIENLTGTSGFLKKTGANTWSLDTNTGISNNTITIGNNSIILGAAATKGVTDNSSNKDVTSSDTNLITARTLYYQLAKKGYTTNTGTVTSITPGNGLINGTSGTSQTAITGSGTISIGEGKVTNAMLANSKITIAGNEVSLGGSISLADLGLSSAMTYKGSLSSLPAATSSTTYSTYATGDVITISSSGKEYVYNKGSSASNSSWVELGDESSYKIKQTAISNSTGTADGTNTSTTFVYSFSQDADGVVSTKTRALPEASSSTKGITTVGASGGAATYGHTHTLSIASGGTSPTALAANTTYTLTAGGSTYVFTTPADTTYSAEKGISLSSGKFGHSNTAITAQSTEAIYPIKIDAYGHITAYGTAVTPLTAASTLDATKLSGTIPSGCYTNTDEKVKQNSSTTSAAYKLLMTTTASPTSGNTYETNYSTELSYNPSTKVLKNGTITLTTASSTSANGNAYDVLSLGNSTNVTSTTAHSEGKINIYSAATKSHIIVGKSTTTDYTHTLPNQTGLLVTLNSAAPSADIGSTTKPVYVSSAGVITEANTYAGGTAVTLNGTSAAGSTASFYAPTGAGTSGQYLKSNGSGAPSWTNFPTIPSITLNGSSTTSPSFYAPTSAGTSGQYLKSNGSGAPTWANMPAAVTATSSGSGNVVTGMSVTNNAITYTLGTVSTVSAQIVRW